MKNLKIFLLVAVCTIGIDNSVHAQKTAHINADLLIASIPQTKALQVKMETLQKTYNDEITGMANELEAKIQKYTSEQATQNQSVNDQRAQEVQDERARIRQAEEASYKDMQKIREERLRPILAKAHKAIKDVANEKGIIYVLDASSGKGLLLFDKGEDLLEAVKAKLGY